MPNNKRRIYALEGLTPEVRAVTFAKCSRSPESFADIARELTEEKSAEFHEKWVVGYGHSSVAEHAVLSIAMENVSILATKVIEDNRLASYTEKSTRYQVFDRDQYYRPAAIMNSDLARLYEDTGNFLFDTYTSLFPKVLEYVKENYPCPDGTPDKIAKIMLKAKTCDIIRYILPVATQTNLGMTINARNLEYAIRKLLSHPLTEMQEIGMEIKKVALEITPTLVKYADYNKFLAEIDKNIQESSVKFLPSSKEKDNQSVVLVDWDKNAEDKIVTALMYRASDNLSALQVREKVKVMSGQEKEEIFDAAFQGMDKYDWPIRELEHTYYTFDVLVDYGAFRDIQRHRMCTQTNQLVTCNHGYLTPEDIVEAGFEDKFKECMARAADAFNQIKKESPKEAQYVVPLAYRKRVLITANLREWHHFIKLRSSKMGHISYRRIAQEIYQEIRKVHPILAKYIQVDLS